MRTQLPFSIDTVEEAREFLQELFDNDESYHPEDDAHDIIWNGTTVDMFEKDRLNELMEDMRELEGFDACEFLMDLIDRANPGLFTE